MHYAIISADICDKHDDSYGNTANPMVLFLRLIPSLERLVVILYFCKQDSFYSLRKCVLDNMSRVWTLLKLHYHPAALSLSQVTAIRLNVSHPYICSTGVRSSIEI